MAELIPPRRNEFLTKVGVSTQRFAEYLEGLAQASNSSVDEIARIFELLTGFNEFDDLFTPDALEQVKADTVVTSANYTTLGDQVVICTSSITVTLNDEPEDQELVKVIVTNGKVNISANGKTINNQPDAIIRRNNTTWDIMYVLDIDEWRVI